MDNPGLYNLGDKAITTALTDAVITESVSASGSSIAYRDRLDGMLSATIQANFTWGGGGTSVSVRIETSLEQGANWVEVARFQFTTQSAMKLLNIVAGNEIVAIYQPAALTNDTGKSGIFGTRWRCIISSVGTYTGNTALTVRMAAR